MANSKSKKKGSKTGNGDGHTFASRPAKEKRPDRPRKPGRDINTLLLDALRTEVVGGSKALVELFAPRETVLRPGQCANGCKKSRIAKEKWDAGERPKFCMYCGARLADGRIGVLAEKGVQTKKTDHASSVRSRVNIGRLCATAVGEKGCPRRVQKTSRGVVVKGERRFVFAQTCEPCNRAVNQVRAELRPWGENGYEVAGLVATLRVYDADKGPQRAGELNSKAKAARLQREKEQQEKRQEQRRAKAKEARDKDFAALQSFFKDMAHGDTPYPHPQEKCGVPHRFCGETHRGYVVRIPGSSRMGYQVVELCKAANAAYVSSLEEDDKGRKSGVLGRWFDSREAAKKAVAEWTHRSPDAARTPKQVAERRAPERKKRKERRERQEDQAAGLRALIQRVEAGKGSPEDAAKYKNAKSLLAMLEPQLPKSEPQPQVEAKPAPKPNGKNKGNGEADEAKASDGPEAQQVLDRAAAKKAAKRESKKGGKGNGKSKGNGNSGGNSGGGSRVRRSASPFDSGSGAGIENIDASRLDPATIERMRMAGQMSEPARRGGPVAGLNRSKGRG